MDFSLSDEQRMMVDAARRLVDKHIQPILDAHDKDRALPKPAILEIMAKAAELGLTSARIPEHGGGAGLRMLDYGLLGEQMPPSVALILQPHEAGTGATGARRAYAEHPGRYARDPHAHPGPGTDRHRSVPIAGGASAFAVAVLQTGSSDHRPRRQPSPRRAVAGGREIASP